MTLSTTSARRLTRAAVAVFWLLIWQVASAAVGQDFLLVSPLRVFAALVQLAATGDFWLSVASSFGKILCGFLLALSLGTLFAALAYRWAAVRELLYPLVMVVKSTPVASIVVLALLWVRSENLSVLASLLMAFPIVYQNLLAGLQSVDRRLLEMAEVFRVGTLRRIVYLYIPAAAPFFASAASLCVGLCWKSGIAAEIIGLPDRSVGGALYQAKIFLSTGEMFAWTLVIVLVSIAFERAVLFLARLAQIKLEGV